MITVNNLGLHVLIKRFKVRFKWILNFYEVMTHPYENCDECGSNYCLCINVKDDKWIKVNGKDQGCLCMDCFLRIAQEKGISITIDDFDRIWIFNPDGESIDIVNKHKGIVK